jgi:hypothetical protein
MIRIDEYLLALVLDRIQHPVDQHSAVQQAQALCASDASAEATRKDYGGNRTP